MMSDKAKRSNESMGTKRDEVLLTKDNQALTS